MNLSEIQPQKHVDYFCSEYRRLDQHLKYPKQDLKSLYEAYSYFSKGVEKIKISKYVRNLAALEKLESFINHLDSFFISIEYFQGKSDLIRTEAETYSKEFKDKLFLKMAADSFRSSLDIYAKFVSWYFDLNGKKEIGFSYDKFIVEVRNISTLLGDKLNLLNNSKEFKVINRFRNADKHEGFDRFNMTLFKSTQKFNFTINVNPKENTNELIKNLITLLGELLKIIKLTIDVFVTYELGYDSKTDIELTVREDGGLEWNP